MITYLLAVLAVIVIVIAFVSVAAWLMYRPEPAAPGRHERRTMPEYDEEPGLEWASELHRIRDDRLDELAAGYLPAPVHGARAGEPPAVVPVSPGAGPTAPLAGPPQEIHHAPQTAYQSPLLSSGGWNPQVTWQPRQPAAPYRAGRPVPPACQIPLCGSMSHWTQDHDREMAERAARDQRPAAWGWGLWAPAAEVRSITISTPAAEPDTGLRRRLDWDALAAGMGAA